MITVSNLSFIRKYGIWSSNSKVILRDITFEISRGDRIALLGSNGTGKSTLLRLLADILQPSSGTISRLGRVTSLLDPAYGMSEVLSPQENCRTRLIMDGISTRNIGILISQIEEFADIGEYFRKPMNTLSSGMWARVAFSLATALPQEVLLIDEGFGLADHAFRARATARLSAIYRQAQALVLASHDASLLRSVCLSGIILRDNSIAYIGDIDSAIALHETAIN